MNLWTVNLDYVFGGAYSRFEWVRNFLLSRCRAAVSPTSPADWCFQGMMMSDQDGNGEGRRQGRVLIQDKS
jgi:hypothetical protein